MTAVQLLRREAEMAFKELKTALDGVAQPQAWAVLPNNGPDYLHSDASIHGTTLHVAGGKRIYGSIGFRNSEFRWRHIAEQFDAIEPDWSAALDYLDESQRYWLDSWSHLTDADLETPVPHFHGRMQPAWEIITIVTQHDVYHAGQIAVFRYANADTEMPPPSVAEDIRKYCTELPSW